MGKEFERTVKFRIYAEKNSTQAKEKDRQAKIDNHNKLMVSIRMARLISPNTSATSQRW